MVSKLFFFTLTFISSANAEKKKQLFSKYNRLSSADVFSNFEGKCTCPNGYVLSNELSCVKRETTTPQLFCENGELIDNVCVQKSAHFWDCPDGYVNLCRVDQKIDEKCCVSTKEIPKATICLEGAEEKNDSCKRLMEEEPEVICPEEYILGRNAEDCIKVEEGKLITTCLDKEHRDGGCVTKVPGKFIFECPFGSACESDENHEVNGTQLCSRCVKSIKIPAKCSNDDVTADCDEGICSTCSCPDSFVKECNDTNCECIKKIYSPLDKKCLGEEDENGNCFLETLMNPQHQCEEGYTCVNSKGGQCKCLKITEEKPRMFCRKGELKDGKCVIVAKIAKLRKCEEGYEEKCTEKQPSFCSCVKSFRTQMVPSCPDGTSELFGDCIKMSLPSLICEKGKLVNEVCEVLFVESPHCQIPSVLL